MPVRETALGHLPFRVCTAACLHRIAITLPATYLHSAFLNSGELSLQLVTVLHSLRPMARRGFPCRHLVLLYARPWWNSVRERQELGSSLESPVWQRLPHGSSPGAYGGA